MLPRSNTIFPFLIITVQFSTSQNYSESHAIPIVSDKYGNLCFGDPFERNEIKQRQSPTDVPQPVDKIPWYTGFSQELYVEPPRLDAYQPQAINALLTDKDVESPSVGQCHPLYAFMRSAKVHQNMAETEIHQQDVPSTFFQEPIAIDMETQSFDTNLGTLLACGNLGPLSIDSIDVEPLIADKEVEILLNDTSEVRNAGTNMACQEFSGSACIQSFRGTGTNCSQSLLHPGFFKNHFINQTDQKPIKCGMFQKQFYKPSNYWKHQRKHTGEKAIQCDTCPKKFGTSTQYQRHRRVHTGEKPFQCDMCPKKFRTSSDCQKHRRTHTGEKPFKCDFCSKKFSDRSSYQAHRRIHTGEKTFQCDICTKKFGTSVQYQRHRRIHTGEKPFQCDMCPKKFRTSSDCQKHRRTHTGEKPFKCDFCQKEFGDSTNFQAHRRIHTGEKPFQCDMCPKKFRTSSDCQKHRRTHTGEKPFKCDFCSKKFSDCSSYQAHRRIHTGEKTFQCDICTKQFRTSSNYERHRRTHELYICYWCSQDYYSKSKLINHITKCSSRNASCTADPVVSFFINSERRTWIYMQ